MMRIHFHLGLMLGSIGMAAAPAAAQWWWPPDMHVDPPCPHPSSSIVVTLSGQWPDACPPNTAERIVVGQEIDIRVWRDPPPGFCLTVITPWSLPVPIGSLAEGQYTVYGTHVGPTGPLTPRVELGTIQVSSSCPGACYANCDGSTTEPVLNVADFSCFLSKFAAGDPYANCDGSTTEPVLNVADFSCFLGKFAAGCR
jgi:hypothetical protein